ncbi:MAG: RNHCP domain-containing protein [Bacilli bacterium]|nr:RNHCP domain-containing protein [Bacilli bacterium]
MKTFNEIDESFTCEKCGFHVERLGYSCRDHCPNCLYSKHVDKNPGDRKNKCQGLLKPIGMEKFKDTYKIVYLCEKCGKGHKNIMAKDDNMHVLINLSVVKK